MFHSGCIAELEVEGIDALRIVPAIVVHRHLHQNNVITTFWRQKRSRRRVAIEVGDVDCEAISARARLRRASGRFGGGRRASWTRCGRGGSTRGVRRRGVEHCCSGTNGADGICKCRGNNDPNYCESNTAKNSDPDVPEIVVLGRYPLSRGIRHPLGSIPDVGAVRRETCVTRVNPLSSIPDPTTVW
jgi:hypothetical protein